MDPRALIDILLQHLVETTLERNLARVRVEQLEAALQELDKIKQQLAEHEPKPRAKRTRT